MKEAHIAGKGIAVPYPISTDQFQKIDRKMREHQGQEEHLIERLKTFSDGTGIKNRHYVHPHWLEKIPVDNPPGTLKKDIFTKANFIPSFPERMQVFQETCVELSKEAARKALADWGGDPQKISHILTTCTSGWSEPGIAVSVIQELNLPHNCAKAELNFNGCFCGATCLRLARDIIRAGDATGVLVVACEVASTHYDVNATDLSSLVAHSLFADGAAAFVIAPEGDWKYVKTGMNLVPKSEHLLGLNPPLADSHTSYRMILNKHTGKKLGDYFRSGLGHDLLDELAPNSHPALGIHPGGPNILDNIKSVVTERGWKEEAMDSSYHTLQHYGNLGAAAMLFVLVNRLDTIEEEELITMAFGPGVTVEWAKLEKA